MALALGKGSAPSLSTMLPPLDASREGRWAGGEELLLVSSGELKTSAPAVCLCLLF